MEDIENTSQAVMSCYDFLDAFASCGISDFTDGVYNGDPEQSYQKAQENQANWLLDQIGCGSGARILDIGCGYGRVLKTAENRGTIAVGITVSEKQARRCVKNGLDVRLMNYRNMPDSWANSFDGVIANGSAEHFVQVQDAVEGKQDQIYQEMFKLVHMILKPKGKFATTIVHFNDGFSFDPKEIVKGPSNFKRGTLDYHCAQIARDFGGWYPTTNQLGECARGYFELESREDGTEDYHITSETWLNDGKRTSMVNPKAWAVLAGKFVKSPKQTIGFLDDLFVSQAWMKQFRDWEGKGTPTKLYRDVWRKV
ncbi:MAG: class I SAM-dependent methyltransferase [Nanoarchaeota archaeon]|nr:class I SAM-dependent methyltransferase [Nanoarchaeota archaeon]MBU1103411.1 class I SAM-dependent methyltransferase [Nanoarchaeota archaeon]MBU1988278.1 class I SAM-dependent methyltransferase [Nanoarchaeota archaeon]